MGFILFRVGEDHVFEAPAVGWESLSFFLCVVICLHSTLATLAGLSLLPDLPAYLRACTCHNVAKLTLSCCLMLCSPVTAAPQLGWIPAISEFCWMHFQASHLSRHVSFPRTVHFVDIWTPLLKYLWAFQKGQNWFVTQAFKRKLAASKKPFF